MRISPYSYQNPNEFNSNHLLRISSYLLIFKAKLWYLTSKCHKFNFVLNSPRFEFFWIFWNSYAYGIYVSYRSRICSVHYTCNAPFNGQLLHTSYHPTSHRMASITCVIIVVISVPLLCWTAIKYHRFLRRVSVNTGAQWPIMRIMFDRPSQASMKAPRCQGVHTNWELERWMCARCLLRGPVAESTRRITFIILHHKLINANVHWFQNFPL